MPLERSMKHDPELQAKTIADLAARCEGPEEFEKFDRAFRASLKVSKEELLRVEAKHKLARAKKRARKRA